MGEKRSARGCKQDNGRVVGRARASSGFSLIELLIALAVFGLLLGLGLPSYGNWIASRQLANHAEFLAESLNQARSEAIMRGYRVNLCKSRDRRQCADDGGWEIGWIMFVDQNHNGEIDDDEVVVHTEGPVGTGITISANRPVEDYVSYTSLGHARLLNGALQMGTFAVCKSGQNAIKVILANGARAHREDDAALPMTAGRSKATEQRDNTCVAVVHIVTVCSARNTSNRVALPVA